MNNMASLPVLVLLCVTTRGTVFAFRIVRLKRRTLHTAQVILRVQTPVRLLVAAKQKQSFVVYVEGISTSVMFAARHKKGRPAPSATKKRSARYHGGIHRYAGPAAVLQQFLGARNRNRRSWVYRPVGKYTKHMDAHIILVHTRNHSHVWGCN